MTYSPGYCNELLCLDEPRPAPRQKVELKESEILVKFLWYLIGSGEATSEVANSN